MQETNLKYIRCRYAIEAFEAALEAHEKHVKKMRNDLDEKKETRAIKTKLSTRVMSYHGPDAKSTVACWVRQVPAYHTGLPGCTPLA